MNNATYEKCPVCGKKGWYIRPLQYERDRDIHTCRYCYSHEYIDYDDKHQRKLIRATTSSPPVSSGRLPTNKEK